MQIARIGSQPSIKGPETWFTGTVRIGSLFERDASARHSCGPVAHSLAT